VELERTPVGGGLAQASTVALVSTALQTLEVAVHGRPTAQRLTAAVQVGAPGQRSVAAAQRQGGAGPGGR
jgi:hypothetical protein